MVVSGTFQTILAMLVALAGYGLWNLRPFLMDAGVFTGFISNFGADECIKISGPTASEKIVVHHRSGTAFMVSSNLYSHTQWYPPRNRWNATVQQMDEFYKYDIETGIATKLSLRNFPTHNDLVLQGFDIWDPLSTAESQSTANNVTDVITLLAINHKHNTSSIEIFEHTLGSSELIHVETVEDPELRLPHDIVAIGPKQFYATNSIYHRQGLLRLFEVFTMRSWSNIVVRLDPTLPLKVAVSRIGHANGIVSNWDRSLIYVASSYERSVIIFQKSDIDEWTLDWKDLVYTGLIVENLSVDEISGEIYAAGYTHLLSVIKANRAIDANPYLTEAPKVPSRVIKISNNTKADRYYGVRHNVEDILLDDGTLATSVTTAAVDGGRGIFLLGGTLAESVTCKKDPTVVLTEADLETPDVEEDVDYMDEF